MYTYNKYYKQTVQIRQKCLNSALRTVIRVMQSKFQKRRTSKDGTDQGWRGPSRCDCPSHGLLALTSSSQCSSSGVISAPDARLSSCASQPLGRRAGRLLNSPFRELYFCAHLYLFVFGGYWICMIYKYDERHLPDWKPLPLNQAHSRSCTMKASAGAMARAEIGVPCVAFGKSAFGHVAPHTGINTAGIKRGSGSLH